MEMGDGRRACSRVYHHNAPATMDTRLLTSVGNGQRRRSSRAEEGTVASRDPREDLVVRFPLLLSCFCFLAYEKGPKGGGIRTVQCSVSQYSVYKSRRTIVWSDPGSPKRAPCDRWRVVEE